MSKVRALVDSIYPNGFKSLEEVSTWMGRVYDKLFLVEEWHEVGDTNEPAFENSWVNFEGGYSTAAFYKDPYGRVHLRGMIKSGTVGAASAFTLPESYRPPHRLLFGTISNGGVGRVDILTSGGVRPLTPSNNTWVTLDGISFRADQ